MTDPTSPAKPAWQTDELEDEWIDEEPGSASVHDKSDLSLTNIVGSILVRSEDLSRSMHRSSSPNDAAVGTFLIREDVPNAPFLPKTPGKSKKSMVKGFFSPLALEMMFEPPSPPPANSTPLPPASANAPAVPSRLSQMYVPGEDTSEVQGDGGMEEEGQEESVAEGVGRTEERRTPTLGLPQEARNYQFTFAPPGSTSFNPLGESTPAPPSRLPNGPPPTDPRLRLFHFQYDTFTRDHLSAMVDSIAVNTPSADTTPSTADGSPHGISRASERSLSRLRSSKRIKLSPASDFSSPSGDGAAFIMRPVSKTRDYVGESRNLMEKIKQNRDFSTVSTTASVLSPNVKKPSESPAESAGNRSMMRSNSSRECPS